MGRPDATEGNVRRYRAHAFPLFAAERTILDRLVHPGTRVLDLGCGNGRVTRHLVRRGARVWACDLSLEAVRELVAGSEAPAFPGVQQADARRLPYRGESLDLVLFAYNGLDFIVPREGRVEALREAARVLRPGGRLVFSSHNPTGTVLSPRGLRSPTGWRTRLAALRAGRGGYVREPDGSLIHYATPGSVVEEVHRATPLRMVRVLPSRSEARVPRFAVAMLSAWPYYVFRKPGR